jgi:hypothetical protein
MKIPSHSFATAMEKTQIVTMKVLSRRISNMAGNQSLFSADTTNYELDQAKLPEAHDWIWRVNRPE